MFFSFINPWMLLGLLGLSLPILVHLISRRKYDTVDWGAMQFLELGRRVRRRMRLEELLLMCLRMLMIAMVAIALARPWVSGGLLGTVGSNQSRDLVLIVDGSYSMGWKGAGATPHQRAREQAAELLDSLQPGDTVSLLDARDVIRRVVDPPISDLSSVRQALQELPDPSGSSDMGRALLLATQILAATENEAREIVVLTDGQKYCWELEDEGVWERLDRLLDLMVVKPRIWVRDVAVKNQPPQANVGLDQIQFSRELVVPDFPIRLRTRLMANGKRSASTQTVFLAVDGERVPGKVARVQLEPNGDSTFEIEHRIKEPGSHLVSLLIDQDGLPGDDAAHFAVRVGDALPVLLVDGDPRVEAVESESFFTRLAFTAPGNPTPWIKVSVVPWTRMSSVELDAFEVIILANVPRIADGESARLSAFAEAGGGLLFALGDHVEPAEYNPSLFDGGDGPLPGRLDQIVALNSRERDSVTIRSSSLDLPWLNDFREGNGVDLVRAGFQKVWQVDLDASTVDEPSRRESVVAIRLESNDPLLILKPFGRGHVGLMTAPLDADWSTLPAKRDYVPFLHELVFYLASNRAALNVPAGSPLRDSRPRSDLDLDFQFERPDGTTVTAAVENQEGRQQISLSDTSLPGVYRLQTANKERPSIASFVARDDRGESDLSRLDRNGLALLQQGERMVFADNSDDLQWMMYQDESRSEIWQLLLVIFIGMLCFEVWLTRRLVRGGHEVSSGVEFSDPVRTDAEGNAAQVPFGAQEFAPLEEIVRREKEDFGWRTSE